MPTSLLNLPNTGSLLQSYFTSSLDYALQGESRILAVLCKKVDEMEKEIHELKTQKIINDTQLPMEIIEANNLLPPMRPRSKRGRGYRPILQSEIEEVQKKVPHAMAQARLLNVSFETYRKYAKLYGIYKPNPTAPGKRNIFSPERGRYPLNKILNGDYHDEPHVMDWMVKDKLIRSGKVPVACAICGYNKRRITDQKLCLLLDHKDGDSRNYKLENIQLLCYNCTFECGRGFIRHGKHIFDADWMQGARTDQIDSKSRW